MNIKITSIDRYRDIVRCCGRLGTVVIKTNEPKDNIYLYNGDILYRKHDESVCDDKFKTYLFSRVNDYVDSLGKDSLKLSIAKGFSEWIKEPENEPTEEIARFTKEEYESIKRKLKSN